MRALYDLLNALHPALPTLFIVIFTNGFFAPPLYQLRRKRPFGFAVVRSEARSGDSFAKYIFYSAVLLIVVVVVAQLLLLASLFRLPPLERGEWNHQTQVPAATEGVPSLHGAFITETTTPNPAVQGTLRDKAAQRP
jgi:hypothetical protein